MNFIFIQSYFIHKIIAYKIIIYLIITQLIIMVNHHGSHLIGNNFEEPKKYSNLTYQTDAWPYSTHPPYLQNDFFYSSPTCLNILSPWNSISPKKNFPPQCSLIPISWTYCSQKLHARCSNLPLLLHHCFLYLLCTGWACRVLLLPGPK